MSAPALDVRMVPYTDPLVRPLLAELDHEYTVRYGHSLGDLGEEARRGAEEFGPPDGGLLLLLLDGAPVAGGAFRRHPDPGTAELKRIWTDSAHRRRGLARRSTRCNIVCIDRCAGFARAPTEQAHTDRSGSEAARLDQPAQEAEAR